MIADGEDEAGDIPHPKSSKSSNSSSSHICRRRARWTGWASRDVPFIAGTIVTWEAALRRCRTGPQCQAGLWNRIPADIHDQIIEMALERSELSPRELAVRFTDETR